MSPLSPYQTLPETSTPLPCYTRIVQTRRHPLFYLALKILELGACAGGIGFLNHPNITIAMAALGVSVTSILLFVYTLFAESDQPGYLSDGLDP